MPRHIVSFIVEDKPGVLFKVSNLFRRRGYNIHSITVGNTEEIGLSRMTVTVDADSKVLNQIVEQLDKMVDVIKVKRLDPVRTITREMVMIKLRTPTTAARIDALDHINTYHGLILDIEPESLVAEVTGDPTTIDEFIEKVREIGIEEISRTGGTALERGKLKL